MSINLSTYQWSLANLARVFQVRLLPEATEAFLPKLNDLVEAGSIEYSMYITNILCIYNIYYYIHMCTYIYRYTPYIRKRIYSFFHSTDSFFHSIYLLFHSIWSYFIYLILSYLILSYLPTSISTSISICISISTLVDRSINQSIHPSIHRCLPVCLSSCLSACLPGCLAVCPFVWLSVCPSVRPSVRLSVCLSVLYNHVVVAWYIIYIYIISYHIISYHIISYHIISYHIISYHIISYHIIYLVLTCWHVCMWYCLLYICIDFFGSVNSARKRLDLGADARNIYKASLHARWCGSNGPRSLLFGVLAGQRASRRFLAMSASSCTCTLCCCILQIFVGWRSFLHIFSDISTVTTDSCQDILVKAEQLREPGQTTLLSTCLVQEEVFELPPGRVHRFQVTHAELALKHSTPPRFHRASQWWRSTDIRLQGLKANPVGDQHACS